MEGLWLWLLVLVTGDRWHITIFFLLFSPYIFLDFFLHWCFYSPPLQRFSVSRMQDFYKMTPRPIQSISCCPKDPQIATPPQLTLKHYCWLKTMIWGIIVLPILKLCGISLLSPQHNFFFAFSSQYCLTFIFRGVAICKKL